MLEKIVIVASYSVALVAVAAMATVAYDMVNTLYDLEQFIRINNTRN